jgi:hypothetical protein
VEGILDSPPDDCVKTLAFEGKTYLGNRKAVEEMGRAASDTNIEAIRSAQRILAEQWPLLKARGADGDMQAKADELSALLSSDDCLRRIEALRAAAEALGTMYRQIYAATFEKRKTAYSEAIEVLKGRPEWLAVSESSDIPTDQKNAILQPLLSMAKAELDLPLGATVCRRTGATLPQLESEIQAVGAIAGQALHRLMELAAPKETIERVPVSRLYPTRITNQEELKDFITALNDRLTKILTQGASIILE